jgi:hypothetical protein
MAVVEDHTTHKANAPRRAGTIAGVRLLSTLLDSGAPTRLFGVPMVRALIENKWNEFGKRHLVLQGARFLLHLSLFFAFQAGAGTAELFLAEAAECGRQQ